MNKVNLWVECVLITYDIVSVYPVGDKIKSVYELVWRLYRIVNKYTVFRRINK